MVYLLINCSHLRKYFLVLTDIFQKYGNEIFSKKWHTYSLQEYCESGHWKRSVLDTNDIWKISGKIWQRIVGKRWQKADKMTSFTATLGLSYCKKLPYGPVLRESAWSHVCKVYILKSDMCTISSTVTFFRDSNDKVFLSRSIQIINVIGASKV